MYAENEEAEEGAEPPRLSDQCIGEIRAIVTKLRGGGPKTKAGQQQAGGDEEEEGAAAPRSRRSEPT